MIDEKKDKVIGIEKRSFNIAGALIISSIIGYQALTGSIDKKSAISELKEMKLIEISLKKSIKSKSISFTRNEALLKEAKVCLSQLAKIPNYRFGEDVSWKVVRFSGDKVIHDISYAELSSGKIALGVEYLLTDLETGDSVNLGGGRGISSECLGEIFKKI